MCYLQPTPKRKGLRQLQMQRGVPNENTNQTNQKEKKMVNVSLHKEFSRRIPDRILPIGFCFDREKRGNPLGGSGSGNFFRRFPTNLPSYPLSSGTDILSVTAHSAVPLISGLADLAETPKSEPLSIPFPLRLLSALGGLWPSPFCFP